MLAPMYMDTSMRILDLIAATHGGHGPRTRQSQRLLSQIVRFQTRTYQPTPYRYTSDDRHAYKSTLPAPAIARHLNTIRHFHSPTYLQLILLICVLLLLRPILLPLTKLEQVWSTQESPPRLTRVRRGGTCTRRSSTRPSCCRTTC